jgi:hypothetical protein
LKTRLPLLRLHRQQESGLIAAHDGRLRSILQLFLL